MHNNHMTTSHNPYGRLALMVVLSFLAMYILMYAMVNTFASVYNNLNQVYMAGLMTAPMVILELMLMGTMYQNKRLNGWIIAASSIALLGFFFLIRQQTAISNEQFLRSMIPHHAGAILMCERAPLTDPDILRLCEAIIVNQQTEIDQMKGLLSK